MIDLSWANSALLNLGISSEVTTDLPPLEDHDPILTAHSMGHRKPAPGFFAIPLVYLNEKLLRETIEGEK